MFVNGEEGGLQCERVETSVVEQATDLKFVVFVLDLESVAINLVKEADGESDHVGVVSQAVGNEREAIVV